ncbi:MAG: RNA methyltransferase [Deltaproteobacteria bacterium]|nr:RNA methyltransferase [Deltaproteobacteria bacterium]
MPNIFIILVRPKYSGNLGSVARAMKNMGLDALRLVNPEADPHSAQARQMAPHAQDVLERATCFDSLSQAVSDCDLVVGLTRHQGGTRDNQMWVKDFSDWLMTQTTFQNIALVFGPEDQGLLKEDLKLCQRLVSIPSSQEAPSLNLAQAVMVLCYELFKQDSSLSLEDPSPLASSQEQEGFYKDLKDLLNEAGFLNPQNPRHTMQLLRNLFHRALLKSEEVNLLRGVLRQVRWWAKKPKPPQV